MVGDALVEAEAGEGGLREADVLVGIEKEYVLGEEGGADLEFGGGGERGADDGVGEAGGGRAGGGGGGV